MDRPTKRMKILSDSEGSDNEGVKLPKQSTLKVNDDYAKRFEFNKKREDLHRLEEKYGDKKAKFGARQQDYHPSDDDSSTGESEDSDANLVTEDLDDEIFATLQAIKTKDPRVYDANAKFFKEFDPDNAAAQDSAKKEKPMTLHDYHRENLMAGYTGAEEDGDADAPKTYTEDQEQLRREMVGQMHAAAEDEDDDDDDDFKPKAKGAHESVPDVKRSAKEMRKKRQLTHTDVAAAEKDPETYLSNFMAAQAWRPTTDSKAHAFDSDDSDEDKRADEFEEAYNMRFEDPAKANEKLQSFARDVTKYSVRRDEATGRKKAREREREKKEEDKRERDEERARLRRLKIEEAEGKVKRIREAAGLRGKDVDLDKWRDVIEGDFNDDQWDQEMKNRFGEDYYAEQDVLSASDADSEEASSKKKRKSKAKKPKWDDDIDIKDLVPDFVDDDEDAPKNYTLSSDSEDGGAPLDDSADEAEATAPKRKTKKDRLQAKADAKRAARKDRQAIESIVDASLLPTSLPSKSSSSHPSGFRYRATSPTSFGLSARDILFADDQALNQFAGLKKMAAWRDEERKKRDKKKMSKKGRLRQWRKEQFGSAEEPAGGFEVVLGGAEKYVAVEKSGDGDVNVKEGSRKRKRGKGKKKEVVSGAEA